MSRVIRAQQFDKHRRDRIPRLPGWGSYHSVVPAKPNHHDEGVADAFASEGARFERRRSQPGPVLLRSVARACPSWVGGYDSGRLVTLTGTIQEFAYQSPMPARASRWTANVGSSCWRHRSACRAADLRRTQSSRATPHARRLRQQVGSAGASCRTHPCRRQGRGIAMSLAIVRELVSGSPLERARRHADKLSEAAGKMALVREAAGKSDLRHREIGTGQQVARPLDASLEHIVMRRHAL